MKLNCFLLILFCIPAPVLHAQTSAGYSFPKRIIENLQLDSNSWKEQTASWEFSFIGEYEESLSLADSQFKAMKMPRGLWLDQQSKLAQYKPVEAKQYIIERAANENIIIINEAHYQPLHRIFTTSLLRGLYEKGYRYLGLEALFGLDTALNRRGYPVGSTGYYTQEPQFGNLIREALQLGFIIFDYEYTDEEYDRELGQAKNIAAFMEKHPGKYLIHCGYGHVEEKEDQQQRMAMAGHLKKITGTDPLTINQDALTEHSAPFFEAADYRHIQAAWPAVLVNEKGETYNGITGDHLYDIRLFHPQTSYLHDRPSWLFNLMPGRIAFHPPAKKLTIGYPVLVFAWPAGEDIDTAVPVDIILMRNRKEQRALSLKAGQYTIQIQNEDGKKLQWQQLVQ
ncbi:hypothetical protein [Pseudobacter ginsenosidimutans]|uniref:Uncharacterized protein n=1 Tax=Pseudobacter ginsenosidimutans TaxID=661488 RepID=A0A4Q7N007_9BACT|nr:hypothetical protein [Pseudobacter ginsenosidimutans]QEC43509.1 hypothetical protein FSB84_18110 [Pseudobacter ginsenosidimutans]RZS74897.1 hypothetical protein EV199_0748 [Pseudobacter ginsenosidimutans]